MWLQGIAIFASQGRADLENNCGQYDQLVFQKGIDSGELFDRLKISEADDCQKYKTSITSFGLISVKCRETVNLTDSISSVWKNF